MPSIDYCGAKEEIEKIFASVEPGDRKILFWYDEPKSFLEEIKSDSFNNAKLVIWGKNDFMIKKMIEKDDLTSNFLIYLPIARPKDTENWLLDILMYSEEYYADTIAITMRKLKLTNSDLRDAITSHQQFFNSEARIKKLSSYVTIEDNMILEDFLLGMMCVLVKAENRSLQAVLTELVFDSDDHEKYNELKKYLFEDYLWTLISKDLNYEGEQSIENLVKRFMFTTLIEQKVEFDSLPSYYHQFIIDGQGRIDAKYFIESIKKDGRYRYLQDSIANELKIKSLLTTRDLNSIVSADVFKCFDDYILDRMIASLAEGSLDYSLFNRIITIRNNTVWFNEYSNVYGCIKAVIDFYEAMNNSISSGLSIAEYVKEYVDSYYKIDQEYRHAVAMYKSIDDPSDDLNKLMDRVENAYNTNYLNHLGEAYGEAFNSENYSEVVGIKRTSDFYSRVLQRDPGKRIFVIVSDALRYEIGGELAEKIRQNPTLKGKVDLDYAIAPLPSETRYGMACLLPHKQITYENKNFYIDGKSTQGTVARDAILKDKNPSYAAIAYEDIMNMGRDDLRNYMKDGDKTVVYIYHNVIDKAGHHEESKVFEKVNEAIEELVLLVKKIYNTLQTSNYYITADHGFLYRRKQIEESQKYNGIIGLKPLEADRRYLITNEDIQISQTKENTISGDYKVINPVGYDLFKTSGGGLQYVHGGASLQEIIVPIVHVSSLFSEKFNEKIRPVEVRLKSIQRKITNRNFALEFQQYEKVEDKKVALNAEVFLEDEDGMIVSGVYPFTANSTSDDEESRIVKIRFTLKNIEFDRSRRYFLILRDREQINEYIERTVFTIDLLQLKLF